MKVAVNQWHQPRRQQIGEWEARWWGWALSQTTQERRHSVDRTRHFRNFWHFRCFLMVHKPHQFQSLTVPQQTRWWSKYVYVCKDTFWRTPMVLTVACPKTSSAWLRSSCPAPPRRRWFWALGNLRPGRSRSLGADRSVTGNKACPWEEWIGTGPIFDWWKWDIGTFLVASKLALFLSSTEMALASFRKMALPHRSSLREVNWWCFHFLQADAPSS